MKYSNTSRVLALVSNAAIALAFGALGIYFGVLVAPLYFSTAFTTFCSSVNQPYHLYVELGVLGLTLAIVGGIGTYFGAKAIQTPNDDVPAIKSFVALMTAGAGMAAFLFLNGTVLFNLINIANNVAFVVIACLLMTILLLIAVNIPMVKVFDGNDTSLLFASFAGMAGIALIILSLEQGISYFVINSDAYQHIGDPGKMPVLLGGGSLVNLVSGALVMVGAIIALKGKTTGSAEFKRGELLASAGAFVLGGGLIVNGILNIAWKDASINFQAADLKFIDNGYSVMCIILGAIVMIGALVALFFVITGKTVNANKGAKKA